MEIKFTEFNKIASFMSVILNNKNRELKTHVHAGFRKNEYVFGVHLIAEQANKKLIDWIGINFNDEDEKTDIDGELEEAQQKINSFICSANKALDLSMQQIDWEKQPYDDYYEGQGKY